MAERQSPCDHGCRSGRAGENGGGSRHREDIANAGRAAICLTGGSSPKQLYQLLATDAYRSRIPWDRVHWFIGDERFVAADDPLNNMAMARAAFPGRLRAGRQHPSDSDRYRRSRGRRAPLRERAEILLWRRSAGPCPPAVRSRADGRRARRPYRIAVSRLSGRGGDGALGGRRAQGECRAVRAAGDADVAGARLLPRNAVRGRGRGQARDPDPRVRRRGPAGQPRASRGETVWLVDQAALPENFRGR